ncbi:energy transducer TonB [Lysobacter korlensis]|uniref:Energy transducer TonB n=1 Tax=Lysobacter korlensis TaxID=553636 RepID=A0ABV6RME6_9GAMM
MSAKPAGAFWTGASVALLVLAGCGEAPPPRAPIPRTQPLARVTPPPAYPESLACDSVGGKTILLIDVGVEGKPTSIRVQSGSGQEALDAAAVEAVRGWQFTPATLGGRPVSTPIQVPITFTPPTVRPDRCFVLDEKRARGEQG